MKTNNTFLLMCRDDIVDRSKQAAKLNAKYDYILDGDTCYTDKRPGKKDCKILTFCSKSPDDKEFLSSFNCSSLAVKFFIISTNCLL